MGIELVLLLLAIGTCLCLAMGDLSEGGAPDTGDPDLVPDGVPAEEDEGDPGAGDDDPDASPGGEGGGRLDAGDEASLNELLAAKPPGVSDDEWSKLAGGVKKHFEGAFTRGRQKDRKEVEELRENLAELNANLAEVRGAARGRAEGAGAEQLNAEDQAAVEAIDRLMGHTKYGKAMAGYVMRGTDRIDQLERRGLGVGMTAAENRQWQELVNRGLDPQVAADAVMAPKLRKELEKRDKAADAARKKRAKGAGGERPKGARGRRGAPAADPTPEQLHAMSPEDLAEAMGGS